jgi:hypothetical protein
MPEIKKYDVNYYGGGKNTTGYPYRAIIGLRRDDGTLIGGAYFHRDQATMPDTDSQESSGYISCNYNWEDFPRVMDLLRNGNRACRVPGEMEPSWRHRLNRSGRVNSAQVRHDVGLVSRRRFPFVAEGFTKGTTRLPDSQNPHRCVGRVLLPARCFPHG